MDASQRSAALAAFEAIAREDPRSFGGLPRELFDARARSAWLARLAPDASDLLVLAVFAAHLGRHRLPRGDRPEGRVAYLAWRREQKERQSALVGETLAALGVSAADVARVRALVERKAMKTDADAQLVEDCACLSFLEHELVPFAEGRTDAQLVDILRKTWAKMGPKGRAAAGTITLPDPLARLVSQAVALG